MLEVLLLFACLQFCPLCLRGGARTKLTVRRDKTPAAPTASASSRATQSSVMPAALLASSTESASFPSAAATTTPASAMAPAASTKFGPTLEALVEGVEQELLALRPNMIVSILAIRRRLAACSGASRSRPRSRLLPSFVLMRKNRISSIFTKSGISSIFGLSKFPAPPIYIHLHTLLAR